MCRVLEVSRSGYYAWLKRGPSARARANAVLLETIETIHKESDGTSGAPRMHAELPDRGLEASLNRVARLMRGAEIPEHARLPNVSEFCCRTRPLRKPQALPDQPSKPSRTAAIPCCT